MSDQHNVSLPLSVEDGPAQQIRRQSRFFRSTALLNHSVVNNEELARGVNALSASVAPVRVEEFEEQASHQSHENVGGSPTIEMNIHSSPTQVMQGDN